LRLNYLKMNMFEFNFLTQCHLKRSSFLLLVFFFSISFQWKAMAQARSNQWTRDTETIESTCLQLMACISVNKGDTVDWPRLRNLFLPTARFTFFNLKGKELVLVNRDLDEFQREASYGKVKFREVELFKKIERFGRVAQVFQGYQFTVNDGELIRSGVNCIQLVFDQGRWWIAHIGWQPETETDKVPTSK
jgi:hypothetical protein